MGRRDMVRLHHLCAELKHFSSWNSFVYNTWLSGCIKSGTLALTLYTCIGIACTTLTAQDCCHQRRKMGS